MTEATTTSRILRVLSLLQSRRYWPGPELAERAGVSVRTIRRDIDRIRELGYRVAAERGSTGGYLLEAGSTLPPLLFTGDEAVALAVALRSAAVDSPVRGMADLSVSLLAKLEQVLPSAVRGRVTALQAAVVPARPAAGEALVDPETLAVLALACRDAQIVRFDYRAGEGDTSSRRVEAVALVPLGTRWYLLAWDLERADWRTFRVDRITEPHSTHVQATPRALPSPDAETFVAERLGRHADPAISATVLIDAPLATVEAYLGDFTSGLTAHDDDRTLWALRDERVELLAGALTWLPWPFEIVEGDELRAFLDGFFDRSGRGRRARRDPVKSESDA